MFRFSIRELMLATALVAVCGAWSVDHWSQVNGEWKDYATCLEKLLIKDGFEILRDKDWVRDQDQSLPERPRQQHHGFRTKRFVPMKDSLRSLMLFADPGMGSGMGFLVIFAAAGAVQVVVVVGIFFLLRFLKRKWPSLYFSPYSRIVLGATVALLVVWWIWVTYFS